ncbi:type VI secretion system protein TssA [Acinetobacter sp. ANC 4779]|uniref:type VI secretion system protein TssA n=1 Tax=Acinetobacter sp. ANC 4779 TaxID=2529848 RepID=UPI0010402FAD|nr:type VI secretion system protein TssA [Acinetobacter sp. ANC 4779]TCB50765.1 type VI secretion system protein TssA [Acinetobacter sp. ANC 4779]
MSLELEALLKVISDESPCGIDCSFSNDFHAIKQAKTQDDPLLDQGDWIAEPKQADWNFVSTKSTELLTEKTKDIRLYSGLIKAWSHLYGFEGVAKGLELTQRSLSDFWMLLHPKIDDDDLDQRLGLLQGLINQLPSLVKNIPIINAPPFYSLMEYESLLHQQNVRRKHAQDNDQVEANSLLEQFEQALSNLSKSFQDQNYQAFLEILKQWNILKDVLDGLMGLDAPSFASIDSQLESIHNNLKKIYKTDAFESQAVVTSHRNTKAEISISPEAIHSAIEISSTLTTMNQQVFQPQIQNHVANREQAMQVLQDMANYFQANEPHSPVSYMLQKTIKWSQMPLHEWLSQVIKNENPLETVHELLGVQKNNHDTNNDW